MEARYEVATHGHATGARLGRISRMTSGRGAMTSDRERVDLVGVDVELTDGLCGLVGRHRPAPDERHERRRSDMGRIDLEPSAKVLSGPAPAEPVGPEREVMRWQPARNHVR